MSDSLKSFGQLADEWLGEYPNFETLVFYHDKNGGGHVVITQGEPQYDWQNIFSEDIDLRLTISEKLKEATRIQTEIRSLNREKKMIENAIKKLVKHGAKS